MLPMISSQYLALRASGKLTERSDRNASSQVRIPSSRVMTNIEKSLRPCKQKTRKNFHLLLSFFYSSASNDYMISRIRSREDLSLWAFVA